MAERTIMQLREFKKAMRASKADIDLWIIEGMPVEPDGRFCLEDCQHWHLIGYWEDRNPKAITKTATGRFANALQ